MVVLRRGSGQQLRDPKPLGMQFKSSNAVAGVVKMRRLLVIASGAALCLVTLFALQDAAGDKSSTSARASPSVGEGVVQSDAMLDTTVRQQDSRDSTVGEVYAAGHWQTLLFASIPNELEYDRHLALVMANGVCQFHQSAQRRDSYVVRRTAESPRGRLSLAWIIDFGSRYCEGYDGGAMERALKETASLQFDPPEHPDELFAFLAEEQSPAIFGSVLAVASERPFFPEWERANGMTVLPPDRQVVIRRLAALETTCRLTSALCTPMSLMTVNDCRPDLCGAGLTTQGVMTARFRISEQEQRLAMQMSAQALAEIRRRR